MVVVPEYVAVGVDISSEETVRSRWIADCGAARSKVFRALIAMGAPRSDAEDALQDALEAAMRTRAPGRQAEGWLFVVALRRWYRMRWRQRIFRALTPFVPAAQHDHEGEMDLLVELTKLPERQRAVLVARHVLGLSQNETASALGIAPGTVGSIGHRAIKALRERLGE